LSMGTPTVSASLSTILDAKIPLIFPGSLPTLRPFLTSYK
jgi:hypothetical protein